MPATTTATTTAGAASTVSTAGAANASDIEPATSGTGTGWPPAPGARAHGLAVRGRTREAIELAEGARAALLPHPVTRFVPRVLALSEAGRLADARTSGHRAMDELPTAAAPRARMWLTTYLARTEWLAGHPATAGRLYAEVAALARRYRGDGAEVLPYALAGLAACAALLGDVSEAEEALSGLPGHRATGLFAGEDRLGAAWPAVAHGRVAEARTILADAALTARRTGHLTSEALLLTDIARLGGAAQAADRLTELARACDGAFMPARMRLARALAAGDPDLLLASAAELAAVGADLLAAEAAAAAARAWRLAGRPRQAGLAKERAYGYAGRCEGSRTPLLSALEAVAPLTEREYQIAVLVARGGTNKEIGAELYVSCKTVEYHVRNLFIKLGVTSRREIGRAMAFPATERPRCLHRGRS